MRNYEVYSSAYLTSALAQQQLRQEKMNLEYEMQRKTLEQLVGDLNRQKIELIRQLRSFADTGSVSTRTSPTEITESAIPADLKTARSIVETLTNTARGAEVRGMDVSRAALQTVGEGGGVYDDVSRIASNASKANSKKQAVNTFRAARRLALGSAQHRDALGAGVMAAIASYNKAFEDQPRLMITPQDMEQEQREVDVKGGTSTEVRTTMRDPRALARLNEELDLVQSELETYRGQLTDLTPEQAELRLGRGNPYLQPLQNLREYRQMRSQAERLRSMTDKEKAFYSAIRRHQAGETAQQDHNQLVNKLLTERGEGVNFNTMFDTIEKLKADDEDINDIMLAYVAELAKQQPKNVDISQQVQAEEQAVAKAEDEGARIQQLLDRLRDVDLRPQFMRGGVPQPRLPGGEVGVPQSRLPGVEGEEEFTLREARQKDREIARARRALGAAPTARPLSEMSEDEILQLYAERLFDVRNYGDMHKPQGKRSSSATEVHGKSPMQVELEKQADLFEKASRR